MKPNFRINNSKIPNYKSIDYENMNRTSRKISDKQDKIKSNTKFSGYNDKNITIDLTEND